MICFNPWYCFMLLGGEVGCKAELSSSEHSDSTEVSDKEDGAKHHCHHGHQHHHNRPQHMLKGRKVGQLGC